MFPPAALDPLVLSWFLAECVTDQFRLHILVAPYWLPTVLNLFVDVPHQCPIVNDLVMDVLAG